MIVPRFVDSPKFVKSRARPATFLSRQPVAPSASYVVFQRQEVRVRPLFFQMEKELVDKSALSRQYLSPGSSDAEIGDTVNFRKALFFSRPRRPFHFEEIAGKRTEIEVCLHGECVDGFSALLAQWGELHKRSGRRKTGFFGEFALGTGKEIARFNITFWNRPCAFVLVAPIGTAGMREQKLKRWLTPEGKYARADFQLPSHDSPGSFDRIGDVLSVWRGEA